MSLVRSLAAALPLLTLVSVTACGDDTADGSGGSSSTTTGSATSATGTTTGATGTTTGTTSTGTTTGATGTTTGAGGGTTSSSTTTTGTTTGTTTSTTTGGGGDLPTQAQCEEECNEGQAGECTVLTGNCSTCCDALLVLASEACSAELATYYQCVAAGDPDACAADCTAEADVVADCGQDHCTQNFTENCFTLFNCFN